VHNLSKHAKPCSGEDFFKTLQDYAHAWWVLDYCAY